MERCSKTTRYGTAMSKDSLKNGVILARESWSARTERLGGTRKGSASLKGNAMDKPIDGQPGAYNSIGQVTPVVGLTEDLCPCYVQVSLSYRLKQRQQQRRALRYTARTDKR